MFDGLGSKRMGFGSISLIALYFAAVALAVVHGLVVLWPGQGGPEAPGQETSAAHPDQGSEAAVPPGASGIEAAMTSDVLGSDLAVTEGEPRGSDLVGEAGKKEDKKKQDEECTDGQEEQITLLLYFEVSPTEETRLLLICMFAGALGGLVHALRSFFWYAGCRKLVVSWVGFYVTLPILGATLATVFYLVLRGGFFEAQSGASAASPFGFAALSALVGMFTEQASEKLKEIAEKLFAVAPKGTDQAGSQADAPAVTRIATSQGSNQGSVRGGDAVTITGTGFKDGATVMFGQQPATGARFVDDTTITAVTPAATAAGAVDVSVVNPGGTKGILPQGFVYE
ncbi:MAG TPA: hypothetical protein DD490_26755 [Acidobacteria bacterium]|nr:hypothetical protein [Acidobacteriota bacterium]